MGSLNDTVAAHDRQLHALHNALERMRHELVAARGGARRTRLRDASDEPPPPHY